MTFFVSACTRMALKTFHVSNGAYYLLVADKPCHGSRSSVLAAS